MPDTITELVYGTYISSEECNKLILEKNIYNLTAEELSTVRDHINISGDAYGEMNFMSYKAGHFGKGLIIIPYPLDRHLTSANHGGCYIIGMILGRFEDDVSYTVDDAYCGDRMESLTELVPTKSCCYLLIRYDVSCCKSSDGVAGCLPP